MIGVQKKVRGVRARVRACGGTIAPMFIVVMAVIWVIGVGCAFAEALGAFDSPKNKVA